MKVTLDELNKILHKKFEELNGLTAGTPEYDKALTQYLNLYRLYEEAEKNLNKQAENRLKNKEINNMLIIEEMRQKHETKKTIASAGIPVIGSIIALFIYDWGLHNTTSPFYRDSAKNISNIAGKKY